MIQKHRQTYRQANKDSNTKRVLKYEHRPRQLKHTIIKKTKNEEDTGRNKNRDRGTEIEKHTQPDTERKTHIHIEIG